MSTHDHTEPQVHRLQKAGSQEPVPKSPRDTHDPTAILARLLTNRSLREAFLEAPQVVASELTDQSDVQAFLLQLAPENLQAQAESLISKRQGEVATLIPATWQFLGATAVQHFADYANRSEWPRGYRRHLLDALAFCNYLQDMKLRGLPSDERRWLGFQVAKGRCRVGFVSGVMIEGRPRRAIQVLVRGRGGKPKRHHLYLRHWKELLTK